MKKTKAKPVKTTKKAKKVKKSMFYSMDGKPMSIKEAMDDLSEYNNELEAIVDELNYQMKGHV